MSDWFKDAADKLRNELAKDDVKNIKGNDFLIDFLKDNQPDEYAELDFTYDDEAEEIARLKIEEFEAWLKENCSDWLFIGSGFLWIDKSKHKFQKKKQEKVSELKFSAEEKVVLSKALSSIGHDDTEVLDNLFQKIQGGSDINAIADCALRCALAHDNSPTTLSFNKADKWEIAGDKAYEAGELGFHKSYKKSADIYASNMSHIESARMYIKAIRFSPKSKNNEDIEWLLNVTRHARMQYELSGDSVNASIMFIDENNINLKGFTGFKYCLFLLYKITSDYGQAPLKVAGFAVLIILLCASFYTCIGITESSDPPLTVKNFFTSLYYSVVTFTTLGYGDYSPGDTWVKVVSSLEAVSGLVLTSLFMVSFVRKYSR